MKASAVFLVILCMIPVKTFAYSGGCVQKHSYIESSEFNSVNLDTQEENKQAVKLRTYFCKAGQKEKERIIEVTFLRISELVAGNFLLEGKFDLFNSGLHQPAVIKNEVYEEASHLFRQFGIKYETSYPGEFLHRVNRDLGTLYQIRDQAAPSLPHDKYNSYWLLSYPTDDPLVAGFDVYSKAVNDTIYNTDFWPHDFHQFDGCDEHSVPGEDEHPEYGDNQISIGCMHIWKYLNIKDLTDIASDTKRLFAEEYGPKKGKKPANLDTDFTALDPTAISRHFRMFKYLGAANLPKDFIYLQGRNFDSFLEGCGEFVSLKYFVRPMFLDIAVVKNLSLSNLEVDYLIGSKVFTKNLRRNELESTEGNIAITPNILPPQKTLIVPLRITFGGIPASFSNIKGKALYDWVRTRPQNEIIKSDSISGGDNSDFQDDSPTRKFKKSVKSFKPPVIPRPVNSYIYGPEISVSGLSIEGMSLNFKYKDPNLLAVTAATADRSCPYFYSRDSKRGIWVSHGKIVADANGVANIQSEFIQVKPGTTKVAIFEEEMEVSFIDKVQMVLELSNGKRVFIKPNTKRLAAADGEFLTILPFQGTVIEFDWPSALREADVLSSKVEVFGYYKRSVFAAK